MLFHTLQKRYPPKFGLLYILGIWNVPWIIRFQTSFHRQDKLKCKIASQPKSDLAYAYYMGLEDGAVGKIDAEHQALGCSDSYCFRCNPLRQDFPKSYRTTDEVWFCTGQGTEYPAFTKPSTVQGSISYGP